MGQEYSVGHNTDMDLSDVWQPYLRSVTRRSPGRWGTFRIYRGKYCTLRACSHVTKFSLSPIYGTMLFCIEE